ncbi:deoxyribose-phosphate aldolase [Rhodobacter sp. Har01]|uniref:deoxyribose-phosphate aldolase n=1 Tax=Rhodobacter sp. Har01 TaxID=2883999 RepID=UPI001D082E2C|nr:deoxyribose-phosphate aldolase [Rhodobacter sp. Har01]MCB6179616.1 deoxyribose-phosphate aldolase [Rhodobacter sp. Har01]
MTTLSPDTAVTGLLPQLAHARNPGMALDLDWVASAQANTSAIERRCATLGGRRSVKKDFQAAWLLKAVSLIDLTTLSGDDTPGRVQRLCAKAKQPVRPDMLEALGMPGLTTGAVCVYHEMVGTAVRALEGTAIPVAAVSTGFPAGLSPWRLRLAEIGESVKAGAREIDIVISRRHVLTGNWQALYDETREMRAACGDAHMKAILATGELQTLRNVARASLVCMMAGADFIKTSTGKETVNATLPVTLTMIRAIRDYEARTGHKVGYKPAGGISKAKDALLYLALMKDELGHPWLQPDLMRFGASSLLGDIERQLEHHLTGAYSAGYRHAMG